MLLHRSRRWIVREHQANEFGGTQYDNARLEVLVLTRESDDAITINNLWASGSSKHTSDNSYVSSIAWKKSPSEEGIAAAAGVYDSEDSPLIFRFRIRLNSLWFSSAAVCGP